MPLTLITYEKIRDYLSDGEIRAFNNAGADPSEPAPERVGGLIRKACNKIALYVNSCGANSSLSLNQDAVPEELEDSALALIRNMMLSDLPDMGDMEGSPRAKAYGNAVRELQDVASGTLKLRPFTNLSNPGDDTAALVYASGEEYQNWNRI